MSINSKFRLTGEHYDEKVSIEMDHSDITLLEFLELFKKLAMGMGFDAEMVQSIGFLDIEINKKEKQNDKI